MDDIHLEHPKSWSTADTSARIISLCGLSAPECRMLYVYAEDRRLNWKIAQVTCEACILLWFQYQAEASHG